MPRHPRRNSQRQKMGSSWCCLAAIEKCGVQVDRQKRLEAMVQRRAIFAFPTARRQQFQDYKSRALTSKTLDASKLVCLQWKTKALHVA
eukprot:4430977-Alexandrium_andersonii.AAC.1